MGKLKAIFLSIGLAASAFMAWVWRGWRKDVNYQKKVDAINEKRKELKYEIRRRLGR